MFEYLIITTLLLTLIGCSTKKENPNSKKIIGEWTFSRTVLKKMSSDSLDVPPFISTQRNTKGYIFLENGLCINKLGYFKPYQGNEKDNYLNYFGNKTKYVIEKDTLKVFGLINNSWESQRIYSLGNDTLKFLNSDSSLSEYIRSHYKIDQYEKYDKIILSSSGCYGECPVMNISIDKDGRITYYGQRFNKINGLYSSKITKQEFKQIEIEFKKAGIMNLKDLYQAYWTDDESIYITFIKGNKIVKSIHDYGGQSPKELIWAYTPLRYLYQRVKLSPIQFQKSNLLNSHFRFENQKSLCSLSKSEGFFLATELLKGKIASSKFASKYTLVLEDNDYKVIKIRTDGRYYEFNKEVFDLGYNFIDVNKLERRFKLNE